MRHRRRGEETVLPELDHLFQAAEDAGEAGDDQGVDGVWNPGVILLCQHSFAQAGDLGAEGGGVGFMRSIITNLTKDCKGKFRGGSVFLKMKSEGKSLLFVNKKKQKNFIR